MTARADEFLALHVPGQPLLMPNAWDAGSAKLLASLGFAALATTSSGFAMTLGRMDGAVTRDEALAHGAELVGAVGVPVSADLENGFGDELADVVATVAGAVAAGLAGCSIEDFDGERLYPAEVAAERVRAAVEAGHGPDRVVITARAENHIRGHDDLADTIARLQAFQEAGADVLYAPGLTDLGDIRSVVSSVDRPVNVLAMPTVPPVAELAAAGVARISVGGAFAFAALGAVVEAAQELQQQGTYTYGAKAGRGGAAAKIALA
jgi:2-methylisocitrate lyase-like PEP mutase family enzyme